CVTEAADALFAAVRDAAAATELPPEQRLWRGLLAVFAWVDCNREGWRVLYVDASQSAAIAETGSRARERMAGLMVELLTGTGVGGGQRGGAGHAAARPRARRGRAAARRAGRRRRDAERGRGRGRASARRGGDAERRCGRAAGGGAASPAGRGPRPGRGHGPD